jgi:hypothetical protein
MNNNQKDKNTQNDLSDLEKVFFEHFTKRQESNNDFLLRLLLIVGSVIAGYGYLLLKIEMEKYDKAVILFMLIFTEILLMIYFKIIFDEGYAFRRDQIVVLRILKKYGLISETIGDDSDKNKVFTFYYNPLKKFEYINGKLRTKQKGIIFWLPAFHNTLAASIFIIHLLVYGSFFIKIRDHYFWLLLLILAFITSSISLNIVIRKHSWLKKIYIQEFKANENK